MDHQSLLTAVNAVLAGNWHCAHQIVQRDEDAPTACWVHADLHKLEGDAWTRPKDAGQHEVLVPSAARDAAMLHNSRYWYARTGHEYGQWANPQAELMAIHAELETPHG